MFNTIGPNLITILPDRDQNFVDKVPKFSLFLGNPKVNTASLAD